MHVQLYLGVQCGNRLCFNGATCLENFICSCASGYTGNQCDGMFIQICEYITV